MLRPLPSKGGPTLLFFLSSPTAIKHLSLALLLVATVTKAQSGVAAAAEQKKKRFILVELITATD